MPCDYGCIFGISNPCEGINPGDLHSVFRKSASYLVLGGLGSRVFWFYFFNLGKRVHSPLIPRYTKEDEAKLVSERHNDPILPGLKFGDLLKKKISSTMTALPEYVFKKWHYGRMVTVGDSAHKVRLKLSALFAIADFLVVRAHRRTWRKCRDRNVRGSHQRACQNPRQVPQQKANASRNHKSSEQRPACQTSPSREAVRRLSFPATLRSTRVASTANHGPLHAANVEDRRHLIQCIQECAIGREDGHLASSNAN